MTGTHLMKPISYSDKLNEMKIFRIICLIGWGCLTALSLQAQKKVPHSFQYAAEASEEGELKELTQVSYSGTSSIRLYFEEVQLGPHSYLLLKGSDGAEQKLNAEALQNWSNSSAYFNGQSVKVSLYQAAGEEVTLKLKELRVNKSTQTSQKTNTSTLAIENQARIESKPYLPSWAAAVGRFTNGETSYGTGWIAANGAIVTDLNYGGADDIEVGGGYEMINEYDIIEFNVPASNRDGTVNHPAPDDQYPLNKGYHLYRRIEGRKELKGFNFIRIQRYDIGGVNAVGGYTIVEALPNSTGLRPGERIGEYFQVIRHSTGLQMDNLEMELFHYSRNNLGPINQTLRKSTVELRNPFGWLTYVSDKNRFLVYDTPTVHPGFWDRDMEGAPIVYPGSNIAVGIHSSGSEFAYSPSLGTGFRDQDFRKHLGEFFTTAMTYVDQASPLDESNGNIYQPYLTVAEGVQQAADNDILNIARGTYNESVTINKPLKLSAPVGAVVIGAAGGANSRTMQPNIPVALYGDDPSTAFAEEEDLLVEQASLKSFPNPFTEHTELHYTLIEESPVQVKVFDMLGQEVQTLVQEDQPEGEHSVQWDGRNRQGQSMPTGLYIMQLKTGEETSAVRVMKQ